MIDAYEIGIQLALQDGVSAGLQVISRELAEVDRAIQATSANLVNLEHVAQVSLGPAAAGVRLVSGNGQKVEEAPRPEPEEVTSGPARAARDRSDPVPKSSPPATGLAEATSAASLPPIAPAVTKDHSEVAPPPRERDDTPPMAGPPKSESFAPAKIAAHVPTEAVAPVAVASAGGLPPQLRSDDNTGPAAPVASPSTIVSRIAAPERLGGDHPAREERVVTATVAHTIVNKGTEDAKGRVPAAQARTTDPMAGATGRAAAPWSGVEMRVASTRTADATERATAPATHPSDRAEGVSGNVMLDGHLVGYWLSEQMAREASRPPSGTSFFDPRQSPAWTASGSL